MRTIYLSLLLSLSITTVYGQKKAEKLFQNSAILLEKADYTLALDLIEQSIKKANKDNKSKYIYVKAMTYHIMSDTINAKKYYQEVIDDTSAFGWNTKAADMLLLIKNEAQNSKDLTGSKIMSKKISSSTFSAPSITAGTETDETVRIDIIEQVPLLPACKTLKDPSAQKKCLNLEIHKLVNRKFAIELLELLELKGTHRAMVHFTINNKGNVTAIFADNDNPFIALEAKRTLSLLPKMTPGYMLDKPVNVIYTLPIAFKI